MCSHFPNTFSRGTVHKFRGTLVCRGTPFENPWSRLKAVSPFCVHLKSICHSLALCIHYAVLNLPSNIGFLLSEVPNWFRHSELRQEAYKELFRVMNTDTEFEPNRTASLPSENPSFKRWLVHEKVMFNILRNWEELKAYFTSAELVQSQFDTKFKARLLSKCQTTKTAVQPFSAKQS